MPFARKEGIERAGEVPVGSSPRHEARGSVFVIRGAATEGIYGDLLRIARRAGEEAAAADTRVRPVSGSGAGRTAGAARLEQALLLCSYWAAVAGPRPKGERGARWAGSAMAGAGRELEQAKIEGWKKRGKEIPFSFLYKTDFLNYFAQPISKLFSNPISK